MDLTGRRLTYSSSAWRIAAAGVDAALFAVAAALVAGGAAAALIAGAKDFTAIVAANDLLALGAYEAIADAGLSCPGDISVTGFNDMPFVDRLTPPLTTVRIPHYDLGREAARRLIELIETPASPARETTLRPELIVRGSAAGV